MKKVELIDIIEFKKIEEVLSKQDQFLIYDKEDCFFFRINKEREDKYILSIYQERG